MDKVSVVIPTYNRADYVNCAIDSVLNQTYSNVEVIVVDDGSTDQTKKILQPYMSNIRYLYQDNSGVSAARNTGIKIANGEWVAFLDSDDLWLPEKLNRQMKIIATSKSKLGCVICNMQFDPQKGRKSNSFENACFTPKAPQGACLNMVSILLTRFILFNQGAIVNKTLLDKIGGYNEQLKILEDYDIALRLSFICNFGYEATPLVIYRRDTKNSLSFDVDKQIEKKQVLRILENLLVFLNNKDLPAPKLINILIAFKKIELKYFNNRTISFVVVLMKKIVRRSPFYPKPIIEAITLD